MTLLYDSDLAADGKFRVEEVRAPSERWNSAKSRIAWVLWCTQAAAAISRIWTTCFSLSSAR